MRSLLTALAVTVGTPVQAQTLPALPEETAAANSSTWADGNRAAGPLFGVESTDRRAEPELFISAEPDTMFARLEDLHLAVKRTAPGN
ncbi:hypothetical protein [Candidatus Palauibacter sp.]|uniref:hypothetical protein n=1 Tax=Candidatus Palauibacter sp. TaxID=3101350 RepID=UPI003C6F9ECB